MLIAALPTLFLRALKNKIRRSFKAPVTETIWNIQRRRNEQTTPKSALGQTVLQS